MDQPEVATLSDAHAAQLQAQRNWVAGHFDDPADYWDAANQLRVVSTILENAWVSASDTVKLQCLGVAFGDALAATCGMEWVSFSSDGTTWPGLRYRATSLFVHPITMISKRVEAGQQVDVFGLFRSLAKEIESLKDRVD